MSNRINTLARHIGSLSNENDDELKISVSRTSSSKAGNKKPKEVFKDKRANEVQLIASELFSVKGKIALVTGGSIGIGKMIAAGLVANGAKVYICSRSADICEQTAKELNDDYNVQSAFALPGDLSSIEKVEKLVSDFKSKESKLDILINNAGATHGALYEEYPDSAWEKVMNLNVRHVFNLTKLLTPELEKAGNGPARDPARVINIASIDGIRATQTFGPTFAIAYTTSKGAVVHMTKALCRALSSKNITVNCIAPGVFPSNMTKFMLAKSSDFMDERNPLGRVGRTADIAGTVLYLTSAAGQWTNGAIIPLDGGGHLHSDAF